MRGAAESSELALGQTATEYTRRMWRKEAPGMGRGLSIFPRGPLQDLSWFNGLTTHNNRPFCPNFLAILA